MSLKHLEQRLTCPLSMCAQNFLDLLVTKLCQAAAHAPHVIVQLLEQILSDLGRCDALRLVQIMTPYASFDESVPLTASQSALPAHVRLMALRVTCGAIPLLTPEQVADELPTLVDAVLPAVSSPAVDARKAAVFLFVEVYMQVGDALFPFLQTMTTAQRKLLAVYIEKKTAQRAAAVR